jgi:hypothetical protein
MDKKELRDKFFKEHTYKCENGIPRVVTHPHNLFEWMYEQLTISDVADLDFTEWLDNNFKKYNDEYYEDNGKNGIWKRYQLHQLYLKLKP